MGLVIGLLGLAYKYKYPFHWSIITAYWWLILFDIIAQQVKTTYLMKKCYVSVLISVVKLSFNKMNTG